MISEWIDVVSRDTADKILDNLSYRRGIGDAIDEIDEETWAEIRAWTAGVIRNALQTEALKVLKEIQK